MAQHKNTISLMGRDACRNSGSTLGDNEIPVIRQPTVRVLPPVPSFLTLLFTDMVRTDSPYYCLNCIDTFTYIY